MWLRKSIFDYIFNVITAIVAEVTQPSLGVGYEIGRAVAMGKRILCLYRPQQDKRKKSFIFLRKKETLLMNFPAFFPLFD